MKKKKSPKKDSHPPPVAPVAVEQEDLQGHPLPVAPVDVEEDDHESLQFAGEHPNVAHEDCEAPRPRSSRATQIISPLLPSPMPADSYPPLNDFQVRVLNAHKHKPAPVPPPTRYVQSHFEGPSPLPRASTPTLQDIADGDSDKSDSEESRCTPGASDADDSGSELEGTQRRIAKKVWDDDDGSDSEHEAARRRVAQKVWDDDNGPSPLRNETGHPDYVPLPGQQSYMRAGRKYWF